MEEKERNQRKRELNCQKPMVTLELKKDLMSSSIAGCSSLQPSAMQQSPLRDISRRKNVASSSVQDRPLAIDFESERLLSDNTVERETLQEDHMHRNDTRELKKPNQKSLSTHRNVSTAENCKIVQKSTDDTSTYSSGLLSWKSSVAVAFESIRERFNVFRKLKSTENEEKGKDRGKAASSNSLTRSMSANSKCQEIPPENTVHSGDVQEVTGYMLTGFDNFEEPAKLESNLHVKGNKQTATVLGNQLRESVDDICSKNIVEACAESDDVIDTSPGISSATKRCQKQANNYDNALQAPKDKPVGDGSSLCGMCIRSESGLNTVSNDRIQIVCFGPENEYQSLDTAPAPSETDSKIVHKQPINSAACDIYTCKNCPACLEGKSSHVIAAHLDVSSDSSVACVDQTSDISSRSVSNDLDAINSIKNTEKRKTLLSDSETKLTHISSAEDRDKPCSEESEPEKGDRETYSVYLWNLRNSLEQNTIEVKRIRSSLSDSEDCSLQCHRISIATDEMTETSPLSTPSSERLISRDKSITDSEDESKCRPFFVTPSGRISPRHPNYFRRNNCGFSSSTEGVNDRITCYDCDSNTIKTTLSDKDFDVSQHLFKQQTNAVVAKANVENVPRHQSKGECESQMAEKSLSKRQDQKKLGLVLTGNWSTIDSSEGDPFEDNEKTFHPAARQRTSPQVLLKQMSLPLTNKRDVNSKNASAEDNLLPSIIRFIADEDILSSVDELSVKSKGEKTVTRASNCSATSDKTRHHKKNAFYQ
ncbi:unnamed protein product [Clavelina lepadiformis]|uniref:Uncharacterized protein n=1 Tax=Clavelina lepadiformis TaxID=159417 RepID=A0ABP0GDL8_CLALP